MQPSSHDAAFSPMGSRSLQAASFSPTSSFSPRGASYTTTFGPPVPQGVVVYRTKEIEIEGNQLPEPEVSRTVEDVVDELGIGWGHYMALGVSAGLFYCEGAELLVTSLLDQPIAHDLSATENDGVLLSSVMAGALLGNLIAGPVSDSVGRQFPILFGYSVYILFGLLSSFVTTFSAVATLRFFVGFGFGFGQPAAIALINEIFAGRFRFVGTAMTSLYYALGALSVALYMAFQDTWLASSGGIQWRLILRIVTLPAIILGFQGILVLPESPSFLAELGDFGLARDILRTLSLRNGLRDFSVVFSVQPKPPRESIRPRRLFDIFSEPLATLTSVCISFAVLSFALYSSGYVVPQILSEILVEGSSNLAPGTVVLMAALSCAITMALKAVQKKEDTSSRSSLMKAFFLAIGSAIAFESFSVSTGAVPGAFRQLLLILSCVGLALGPALGLVWLAQAAATISPVVCSASGVSACLVAGRVGAVSGPLICDCLRSISGQWQTIFPVIQLLEIGSALALLSSSILLQPHESDDEAGQKRTLA